MADCLLDLVLRPGETDAAAVQVHADRGRLDRHHGGRGRAGRDRRPRGARRDGPRTAPPLRRTGRLPDGPGRRRRPHAHGRRPRTRRPLAERWVHRAEGALTDRWPARQTDASRRLAEGRAWTTSERWCGRRRDQAGDPALSSELGPRAGPAGGRRVAGPGREARSAGRTRTELVGAADRSRGRNGAAGHCAGPDEATARVPGVWCAPRLADADAADEADWEAGPGRRVTDAEDALDRPCRMHRGAAQLAGRPARSPPAAGDWSNARASLSPTPSPAPCSR